MARTLTDSPNAIIDRRLLIRGLGSANPAYDLSEEQRISSLREEFLQEKGRGFRLISIDSGILEPTRCKRNLRRIAKVEVPKPLQVYGDKPLDLSDYHYGNLDSFGEIPEISFGSWMSVCWKRFIVAKELLHLYSGTDVDDGHNAVSLISAARRSRTDAIDENTNLSDETSGLYLAFETMLPWCLREDQYLWLKEHGATSWQIAKVFMVPNEVIDFIETMKCRDGLAYLELSRKLNTCNV